MLQEERLIEMNTDKRLSMWGILFPLVIYFLINLLVSMLGSAVCIVQVMKDEGFSANMSPDVMFDLVLKYAMQITLYTTIATAALTIPVLWHFFKKDQKLDGTIYTKTEPVNYLWPVVLGLTSCLVGNNLIYFSGALQVMPEINEVTDSFYQGNLFVELLGFGILTPICEELMFRGMMYKRIRKAMTPLRASIMVSLFFAIFHVNLVQGLYAFLTGLLLCYVYERYQNLLAPVLFHVAANLLSVLGSETGVLGFMYTGKTVFLAVTFAMAILLVLAVYMIEMRVHVREVVQDGTGETKEKVDLV